MSSTGSATPPTTASSTPLSSPAKKAMSNFYGSTTGGGQPQPSVSFDFGAAADEDDPEQPLMVPLSRRSSSRLSLSIIDSSNVWTSFQRNAARLQADLVPSKEAPTVKLVLDGNMARGQSGSLYYDSEALYNPQAPPQYALTVHPDIYQKVCQEVSDAQTTPCGLYFCCHGGDGAHTGVTGHKDSVDIRVAMAVMGVFLVALVAIEVFDVAGTDSLTDDFY